MEYISCPLCGSCDARLVFRRKDLRHNISDHEFCVVRCRGCRLVYVNPRPTKQEIHQYYPPEFYEVGLTAEEVYGNLEWQLRLKYGYVEDLAPGRLLDVGCDKGEFMFYMQQRGWAVKGIDFSTKPPNVFGLDILYGDLDEATFPPESFDLVTMWAVLEHVYQPVWMLRTIGRILRPGGKLVVAVTNFRSAPARFMRHDDIPRHTTMFTKQTLREMLRHAGISLEACHFCCELYGGSHRGLLNYIGKLAAGEKIEDIVAMNRSNGRWHEFSGQLRGRPSRLMEKIDRMDIALSPVLDRWMDRLHMGFIMIASGRKIISA